MQVFFEDPRYQGVSANRQEEHTQHCQTCPSARRRWRNIDKFLEGAHKQGSIHRSLR